MNKITITLEPLEFGFFMAAWSLQSCEWVGRVTVPGSIASSLNDKINQVWDDACRDDDFKAAFLNAGR